MLQVERVAAFEAGADGPDDLGYSGWPGEERRLADSRGAIIADDARVAGIARGDGFDGGYAHDLPRSSRVGGAPSAVQRPGQRRSPTGRRVDELRLDPDLRSLD